MSRKPTAIRLDEEAETKKAPNKKPARKAASRPRKPQSFEAPPIEESEDVFDQTPFANAVPETVPPNHLPEFTGGIRWWGIFFSAVGALFTLLVAFWLQTKIDQFFEIHPYLGWATLGLTAIAGLALLALATKELVSLLRLRKLTGIRDEAEQALLENSPPQKTMRSLRSIYAGRADMRWQLDQLKSYDREVMDGPDRVKLAERILMAPLDREAKQIIATAAKRVSVITAINPSPVLDILFVGFQILQMLRKIMALYGGKPGMFGALKLVRMVAAHLAVTGGLAMTDTILQQFLGKGLAGRLSTKLGEGTVNGIMATRIGLAAIDLCRPLPFSAEEQPSLTGFLSEIVTG